MAADAMSVWWAGICYVWYAEQGRSEQERRKMTAAPD